MLLRLSAAALAQLALATLLINLMLYLTGLPTGDDQAQGRALRRRALAWGSPLIASALALAHWCLGGRGTDQSGPAALQLALALALTLPGALIFQFGLYKQFPHLAEQFRLRRH